MRHWEHWYFSSFTSLLFFPSSCLSFSLINSNDFFQIDDYNMVSFVPLDISDEESITMVLAHIDNSIQYGEDLEPKEPKWDDEEDEEGEARMEGNS
jgi:hypothetical protein